MNAYKLNSIQTGPAFIAGLIGAAVMTLVIYLIPFVGLPNMDIVLLLGSMFVINTSLAQAVGIVLHLLIGALFGVLYAWLWGRAFSSQTWLWGLFFGAAHGFIAVAVMPFLLDIHPRPPEIVAVPSLMVSLILAHIAFGITTAIVYAKLYTGFDEHAQPS